jgi:hypothetical protein
LSVTTDVPRPSKAPNESGSARARAARWLARRESSRWIVLLGVVLAATSLGGGLAADDYFHALLLRGIPWPRTQLGPFDLFRFASGDERVGRALMDLGQYPWTADPAVRFGFFRPLSSATHVLDYALWPHAPWAMHAQNVIWYALALAGVNAIYRRFLGASWVAGLALLFFAIDDAHGQAIAWIANRNSILALALALPVIVLHDRWRRDGDGRARVAAPALLALALFAGESALAIGAYVVAYEAHLARGSWRARAIAIAPYAAVLAAWRTLYAALGYGVSNSGAYLDPASQPGRFLAALPRRFPFLLLGALTGPRSDLGLALEYFPAPVLSIAIVVAIAALAVLAAAFIPLVRRDPVARFFATGMLLSALPICAAFTGDRLLLFVSVGAMGLGAQLVASAERRLERGVARLLVIVHIVLAPPLLALKAARVDYQLPVDVACRTLPKGPDLQTKTLVLVDPPNDLFYVYLQAVRAVEGEPRPARVRALSNVVTAADVTRVDAYTLRIAPDDGFLQHEPERMVRGDPRALSPGTVVHVAGMTVTVTRATADGRPAEALFRFDVPLEDPSLVWMCWTIEGFAPWTPPAVGERVRTPPHDYAQFFREVSKRLGV